MADKPPEFDEQKFAASLIELSNLAWNGAIEAAAKIVDQANRDGPYNAIIAARFIRQLRR